MSTYSSTTNNLIELSARTEYGDEGNGQVWRTRNLYWRIFGWEGTIYIGPLNPRKLSYELRYFRYRFNIDHFPHEDSDSEYLAARYKEQKK